MLLGVQEKTNDVIGSGDAVVKSLILRPPEHHPRIVEVV